MIHSLRRTIASVGVIAIAPVPKPAVQSPNSLEIVVGSGPFAGTYHPPAAEIICMQAKAQKKFAATWKSFEQVPPKALGEAGINISNPDEPGPTRGEVRISFGDSKHPTVYDVRIPDDSKGPLTMTRSGAVVSLAFNGKTRDGIALRVSAVCKDIDRV